MLLLGGCESATEPTIVAWEGELQATPPAAVNGSVAAISQFGRTEASILLTGAEAGATYGWRINSGTCDAEGAVVGGAAVYPALTAGAQGSATENTTFAELLGTDGSYAARVFVTADEEQTVHACAELERVQ